MNYEQCMRLCLKLAGDTDTNCCIVGGMVGAYFGKKELPKKMMDTCLNCDVSKGTKSNVNVKF